MGVAHFFDELNAKNTTAQECSILNCVILIRTWKPGHWQNKNKCFHFKMQVRWFWGGAFFEDFEGGSNFLGFSEISTPPPILKDQPLRFFVRYFVNFDLFFYLCSFICIFMVLGCSLSDKPCHGILYYGIIIQYHIYLESYFREKINGR